MQLLMLGNVSAKPPESTEIPVAPRPKRIFRLQHVALMKRVCHGCNIVNESVGFSKACCKNALLVGLSWERITIGARPTSR